MKFFAKLGLNSKVIERTHVGDNNAPTEKAGIEYLNKFYSYPFWKEYKKDGSIRKNKPGIGFTYDEDRDGFFKIIIIMFKYHFYPFQEANNLKYFFIPTSCFFIPFIKKVIIIVGIAINILVITNIRIKILMAR